MLNFLKRWLHNFGRILQKAIFLLVMFLSASIAVIVPMTLIGSVATIIFALPPLGLLWPNQVAAIIGLVIGIFGTFSFVATIDEEKIFKYGASLWPDEN